jgi:ABC-type dipeptide/oligopeptide/nickel transport system permease subunit
LRFWLHVGRRFARSRTSVVSALVLAGLVAACIVVPLLSPYGANDIHFPDGREGPSRDHPLGTDLFGRDLLVRMAVGGRLSLLIGLGAIAVIVTVGLLYGAVAGLAGGKVDATMMRLLDGFLALPRLPIMIVILVMAGLSANLLTLIVALSIANWMVTARLVRAQVLSIRESDYVRAAHASGARGVRLLRRHVVPNVAGVLVVAAFLELPAIVLAEAFVSVLGLGVNPPTATWGTIAQDGMTSGRLWLVLLPSLALAVFAVVANVVADGLNDALDPRRSPA